MTHKIINAIWDGDTEGVESIICDHPEAITSRDEKGRTLLSHAAERGCLEIEQEKGSDLLFLFSS